MDNVNEGKERLRLTRRELLVALGAGVASVAVAACSSGGGAPAATQAPAPTKAPSSAAQPTAAATSAPAAAATAAPAVLKGTTLAFLGGTYFVTDAQKMFVDQLNQWGKENGVTVSADFLNWPDLQAKIAAAIQSGAGADVFHFWPGWAYLYKDNLVDVTDIATAFGQQQGGFYDWAISGIKINDKFLAMPIGTSNAAWNYRISYLKQAGYDKFPDTWDDFFAMGKKLKALGKPIGQALGHSLGDPPSFCYPYMWSYGAMEVQSDGKTVAFDTPQFVDGMKKFIQGWKDGFDPTGLSWDDAANNRAFLSDQIAVTINGSSIYLAAKKDAPKIAEDMDHADPPKGPAGRFYELQGQSFGILKASKNVEGAKDFLKWWFDKKQFGDWLHAQNTYELPPVKGWESDPMWTKDPKLAAFGREASFGRVDGYAGQLNDKAALARSKYIIVDTFAKAVTSGDAAGSIKWGAEQLKQIYGA
jgi:multiple sugar transport system substrate-binding protein